MRHHRPDRDPQFYLKLIMINLMAENETYMV
jgi:hypothetical protein